MARESTKQAVVAPRKIFIVEDHPVFREGLRQVVNREADLQVCGEAGNYDQALEALTRLRPDLALVDITLPGKSGLELIKTLRKTNRDIRLLIISMHDEALYADRVLRAGGDGYIMKQEDPEEVIHAIRDVLGGHIYVSEEVFTLTAKRARKPGERVERRGIKRLNDQELEILESLGRGRSNAEIARQLHLNIRTVAADLARIRKKLSLKSSNALIRYAVCWVETGVTGSGPLSPRRGPLLT